METKEETKEVKGNYYNWLDSYTPNDKQTDKENFIRVFSEFLSKRNPDYYYNESYLVSYFEDFINCSNTLSLRVKLIAALIKKQEYAKFIKKLSKVSFGENIKFVINIDDVVSINIKDFPPIDEGTFVPTPELNNSLYGKELSKVDLNVTYKLSYFKDGFNHEFFELYSQKINLDDVLESLNFNTFVKKINEMEDWKK